ncbi:hypothetical protein U1763_13225 [Sphingomonas sp. LB2R24]|uniref:hypothetical protein n=1 Tax=Sphingomonas sorbitolis TaxID=3096165 RepID=UPI002FC9D1E7
MAKTKTARIPKRIGGVKIPKDLRKTGNTLIESMASPVGRDIVLGVLAKGAGRQVLAAGLMAAAAAIASKGTRSTGERPASPGSDQACGGGSPSRAGSSPPAPAAPATSATEDIAASGADKSSPVQGSGHTDSVKHGSPDPEPAAAELNAGSGPFAGDTPEPPRSDAPALSPEMAKVLDSVAGGLERLFAGFASRAGAKPDKETPSSG